MARGAKFRGHRYIDPREPAGRWSFRALWLTAGGRAELSGLRWRSIGGHTDSDGPERRTTHWTQWTVTVRLHLRVYDSAIHSFRLRPRSSRAICPRPCEEGSPQPFEVPKGGSGLASDWQLGGRLRHRVKTGWGEIRTGIRPTDLLVPSIGLGGRIEGGLP